MQFVTLVNRTKKNLEVCWDGKRTVLVPGKNALPQIVAEAAKRQNPIMGSEDPITLQMDYLVGIEEIGDPIDPIEQAPAIERMNRAKMPNAKNVEVIPGVAGLYGLRDVAAALPPDGGFVKA